MWNCSRRRTTCLVLVMIAAASVLGAGEERLTRSIYVPIEFELCDHLTDGILYQDEQPLNALPGKRIFQFTYYPKLKRMEPMRTDVRVEGMRHDGEQFIARIAVTPWGIYTANTKIELDFEKQLERLRYKVDARHKTRKLNLACSDSCDRHAPKVADAGSSR